MNVFRKDRTELIERVRRNPNRKLKLSGKLIVRRIKGVPDSRRVGGWGYENFIYPELYPSDVGVDNAKSYEEYRANGGRDNDLDWDLTYNPDYIQLEDNLDYDPGVFRSFTTPKDIIQAQNNLLKICEGGIWFTSIPELYQTLNQQIPTKISERELEILASVLDSASCVMAPDFRYHKIKPRIAGDIAIFATKSDEKLSPSQNFHISASILRLAATMSRADENVHEKEVSFIHGIIERDDSLNQLEKDSLCTFLHWCLHTKEEKFMSIGGLRKVFLPLDKKEKISIGKIIICVLCADNRIDPREVKKMESFYTMLGLDKSELSADIHNIMTRTKFLPSGPATEPVMVSHKDLQTNYEIPQNITEKDSSGIRFNQELVHLRIEETKKVSKVLGEIFTLKEEAAEESVPQPTDILKRLSAGERKLLSKVITQQSWQRDKLIKLCDDEELMFDGTMENINEWAISNAKVPLLIDEGDLVYVDIELADEIMGTT